MFLERVCNDGRDCEGMQMTSYRWWISVSAVVVITVVSIICNVNFASGEQQDEPRSALMLAKLASTQRIAEGLVSQDFQLVRRGAEEIERVCDASLWESNADPIYGQHRTELRRHASKLVRMAAEQNLDGSAFAYMNCMSSCINCHQHCRDVLRIADRTNSASRVVPIPVTDQEWVDGRALRR